MRCRRRAVVWRRRGAVVLSRCAVTWRSVILSAAGVRTRIIRPAHIRRRIPVRARLIATAIIGHGIIRRCGGTLIIRLRGTVVAVAIVSWRSLLLGLAEPVPTARFLAAGEVLPSAGRCSRVSESLPSAARRVRRPWLGGVISALRIRALRVPCPAAHTLLRRGHTRAEAILRCAGGRLIPGLLVLEELAIRCRRKPRIRCRLAI